MGLSTSPPKETPNSLLKNDIVARWGALERPSFSLTADWVLAPA